MNKIDEILGKEATAALESYIEMKVNQEFDKLENKKRAFKLNTLHWVFIFFIFLLIGVIFTALIFKG